MILYDISVTISSSLHRYPGDPPVRLCAVPSPVGDEPFVVTRLSLGSHTGTHIDAPAHLIENGATVDEVPLSLLIGTCLLLDLRDHAGAFDAATLKKLPLKGHRRLLLRTGNSRLWDRPGFVEEFQAVTEDGAAYLIEEGIQLIGIDYLSVEPFRSSGRVHRRLLEAGVVILEGLNLTGVERGEYELICLPLKLGGADAAPCRAVLRGPDEPPPLLEHRTRWPL